MTDRKLADEHTAAERARFARELHDGLIAVEMQVDVLRRQTEANLPIGAELGRIQSLLREEVLKLRERFPGLKRIYLASPWTPEPREGLPAVMPRSPET